MTTVHAWQHVYANVENERSPRNRGGFQTLFSTLSALTEAEVEEMEARLLYFPSEGQPVKRVFFTTSTGKSVVAQIVPLADLDQSGRGGRYLAHSLVFAPEAFVHFGSHPFQVFRQFPFITSVEEALERGDFQTGDIPAVSLEVPTDQASICGTHQDVDALFPPAVGARHAVPLPLRILVRPPYSAEPAQTWPAGELKKFVLLALRARQLASDRSAVAVVGEPQQVESALETAFMAVPTLLRPHCSFDTYFYKCNLVATYYWAVGLLEPPNSPRFTVVDVRSHQVQGDSGDQPQTAYERWVLAMIDANNLDFIVQHTDHAFALCEWLESRASDVHLVDVTPSEVVSSVFQVNAQQVRERLRQRLSEQLSPVLVNRIFEQLYRETNPLELFRQLRQGVPLPQLLEALYEAYTARRLRAPEREETQALGALLRQADHHPLRLVYLCWTDQRTQLHQALEQLPQSDYRTFLQTALRFRFIDPLLLLVPGKGDLFLALYLQPGTGGVENLGALVRALTGAGEFASLAQLSPYITGRSGNELRSLQKFIEKTPGVPESFRQTVDEAVTATPPPQGMRDRLRGWLGGFTGRARKE
jgi:hypothetical protein